MPRAGVPKSLAPVGNYSTYIFFIFFAADLINYMKKVLFLLAVVLISLSGYTQSAPYELSAPIDLPATGTNQLLLMKNGNTLLFHFENTKAILVKVFDKNHKEIAQQKHVCDTLDINALDRSWIVGLYEINGEAVLFFEQAYLNRNSLIRLRIHAETGKLIKEDMVFRADGFSNGRGCGYYVAQKNDNGDYQVLCFRNTLLHPEKPSEFYTFNSKHEIVKRTEFSITMKDPNMRYLSLISMREEPEGAYCIWRLNGEDGSSLRHEYIGATQLLDKDSLANTHLIELENTEGAYAGHFSYNQFAETENMFLTSKYITRKEIKKYFFYDTHYKNYFCPFNKADFSFNNMAEVKNSKVETLLYEKTSKDTVHNIELYPYVVHTNQFGATTVIYQERGFLPSKKQNEYGKNIYGNIGISILDDQGTEIFATAIPQRQDIFGEYYDVFNFKKTAPFEYITNKSKDFILMNINKNNFDKQIGDSLTVLNNWDRGNAICYVFGKDRKLTKSYMFGDPATSGDNCAVFASSYYNRTLLSYATLLRHKEGNNPTEMRIGWYQVPE